LGGGRGVLRQFLALGAAGAQDLNLDGHDFLRSNRLMSKTFSLAKPAKIAKEILTFLH
jgi:hypothetical protein